MSAVRKQPGRGGGEGVFAGGWACGAGVRLSFGTACGGCVCPGWAMGGGRGWLRRGGMPVAACDELLAGLATGVIAGWLAGQEVLKGKTGPGMDWVGVEVGSLVY